ncbi:unnamed protein product, partial [Phaeothamnion confervicola]
MLTAAREQLQRKLERSPDNETLLRRLADVLRQLGDREEAARLYNRLGELFPGDEASLRLARQLGGSPAPAPKAAWPVGFWTQSNFLDPPSLQALQEFTLAHAEGFDSSKVLHDGVPQLREDIRKSSSLWDIEPISAWFNPLLSNLLPRIQRELGF